MNLAKLQDTKSVHRNYLHFYKLTTKNQTEIKESISFTIATKINKYLGINLTKETKELYTGKYKILMMKEIKDDINRWRDIPHSWIGRINIVKMTIPLKSNLQIQCNPYQITNGIFHRIRTKNFTIHMETQNAPNSQSSFEKEEWS